MTQIDFRRWGKITLGIVILYTLYISLRTNDPFWLIIGCIGILVGLNGLPTTSKSYRLFRNDLQQ